MGTRKFFNLENELIKIILELLPMLGTVISVHPFQQIL